MTQFTGKDLIELGMKPGPHFRTILDHANATGRIDPDFAAKATPPEPQNLHPLRTNNLPFANFLVVENEAEQVNHDAVVMHMDALLRTPTIKKAAVMPDACPAGSELGTIPVGGVVACENAIHPGFHSADICCSMAFSSFRRAVDPARVLDAVQRLSHFGPAKKPRFPSLPLEVQKLVDEMSLNPFLTGLEFFAERDFMTQGDGNHFFYVGEVNGSQVIVTHHGSRGLGAQLYKRGKACAERMTRMIAPEVPKHNAWIPADTDEGYDYWTALQLIRRWTKLNHFHIHDLVTHELGVKVEGRHWNEHNFVFQRADGLFYHAKGATPVYNGFAKDSQDIVLIPMNMGREIIVGGTRSPAMLNSDALGFAPHGAGRLISRTRHIRALEEEFGSDARGLSPRDIEAIMQREVGHLDARFYCGRPDVSELPSAYKSADQVIGEIESQKLVSVIAKIEPQGSMMAGEFFRPRRKSQKASQLAG